jgi:hypothetical protein
MIQYKFEVGIKPKVYEDCYQSSYHTSSLWRKVAFQEITMLYVFSPLFNFRTSWPIFREIGMNVVPLEAISASHFIVSYNH